MTPQERMLIEHECTKLCLQLALFTDTREFEKASDCFAVEGTFARPLSPERILRGRREILEALRQKPPGDSAQHCCTNILIEVQDSTHAVGTIYFTVFSQRGAAGEDSSGTPKRFMFVGVYHDRYMHTDAGWKIEERTGSLHYRCNWFPASERSS